MKGFFKASLIGAFACVLLIAAMALTPKLFPQHNDPQAWAATSNPTSGSSGYVIITHPIGSITANTTGIPIFKSPFPHRVVNIMTMSRAQSAATYSLMIKTGGTTSLLSSAISGTTTGWTEGTLIASPNIADEASVTADVTTGTSLVNDLVIEVILKRQ